MRKLICLLAAMLICFGWAYSQSRQVSGVVTSSDDGKPIPGVSIFVKGSTTIGTSTDINGKFTLKNIPARSTLLVFRSVGYVSKEVPIRDAPLSIALEPELKKIEELVVVGYGSARKVGTVVGSVVSVKSEQVKDRPTANVMDALQGKVAGLQVYTSSGEPSAVSSITLHGMGSLGSSSTPLYVIDGVTIPEGSISSFNPADFESVNVLKDASATSIYGSRASNGVILIVTKKGKTDKKGTIQFNMQSGISQLANVDFFKRLMNSKQLTDFWVETGFKTKAQVDEILTKYPNDTKWYKYYYRDQAPSNQGDISFSGGGGKTTYYLSSSYFFQDGLAARSKFERYTIRSNINTQVNSWLSMGVNLTGSFDQRQVNPYGTNSTNRGIAMLAPPFYTPYDKNGKKYPDLIPGWGRYNPEYLAEKNPINTGKALFNGSAYLQLVPVKGLIIKSQAGIDAADVTETLKRLPSYLVQPNDGKTSEYFSRTTLKTLTNTLEYNLNIKGGNRITALLGQEVIMRDYRNFSGSSEGQEDDRLTLLDHGPKNRNVSSSRSEYAYFSLFSRLDYSYAEKYFIDLSLRRDGSSRFAKANRYANFWAFGLMWDAKKETFLQNVDFLSSLSLKFSYGTSGNSSIGDYTYLAMLSTTQYNGAAGFGINSPGNPTLQWEQQAKSTLGLKFSIFKDRFRFNIEMYNRKTSSMLVDVPISNTTGFNSYKSNVGAMRNRGVDFNFNADVLKGKDYNVTVYTSINYNQNRVLELFQGNKYWIVPNTGIAWVVGKPVSFYQPIFAGVDPADGLPMWYKPGSDVSVTTKGETTKKFSDSELLQNTGVPLDPPINGGVGFSAQWKGISLSADFAFVINKYLINNDRYFYENPTQFPGFNQMNSVLDYWKKPGDVTRFPKYGVQFTQFDDRLIENASFLRLKTLTLGYTLPTKMLAHTRFFKSAKIFATSRNLFTITNYSGPDPEVDGNLTLGVYPNTRQYTLGLSLSF